MGVSDPSFQWKLSARRQESDETASGADVAGESPDRTDEPGDTTRTHGDRVDGDRASDALGVAERTDGTDGVLVLDANTQAGLCVVRSLGRRGVSVTAASSSARSLGALSRYSDASFVHPPARDDSRAFLEDLRAHLGDADYDAVVPVMDGTTALLSRWKSVLEETATTVACEEWDTFSGVDDKARLFDALEGADVPTPETLAPGSVSAVADLVDEAPYPAVVKPRTKSVWTDEGHTLRLVGDENYVESPEDLVETYRSVAAGRDYPDGRYPLIQAYVPGATTTTVGVADDGEILTHFQEKRLRTYPDSGGNSALLEAVRDPRMRTYAERVVARFGWTGPFMVEFMETPEREFHVIEVNGRYWGSVPFAVTCGVDVPWIHYQQLVDGDPHAAVPDDYRTDVVQRRLLYEDCKWLCEQLVDGRLGALGTFLGSFATARHTFVYPDDPAPTVAALAQAVGLATREAGRRALALADRS